MTGLTIRSDSIFVVAPLSLDKGVVTINQNLA